jgi:hypothetical protein
MTRYLSYRTYRGLTSTKTQVGLLARLPRANTTTHPHHLDNTAPTTTSQPRHRSAAPHVFRPALLHCSRLRRHRNSARAKHPRADQQSATGLLTPHPPTELHPLFHTPPTISIPRPARAEPTLSLLPRIRFLSCTNCFDNIAATTTTS